MAVSSVNFSQLPYLVLREISSQMDLSELISLSLINANFQRAVSTLKLTVLEFKWLILAPGHFVINIIQKDGSKIIIRLCSQLESGVYLSGFSGTSKIKFSRNGRIFTFQCSPSEKEEVFGNLSKFLLTLFKPEKFNFESNLFMESIFENAKKFENFKLIQVTLSVENARIIFEDIDADVFRLDGVEVETEGFEKFQLKHRDMDLGSAHWLSKESLRNLKCESLKFSQKKLPIHHIQSSDIIGFAKSLYSEGFGNLKTLEIMLPDVELPKIYTMRVEVESELEKWKGVERPPWDPSGALLMTGADGKRAKIHCNSLFFDFSTC